MLKILHYKDFSECTDPVRTEQHIASQLEGRQKSIDTDYTYAMLPLADTINKKGLHEAQRCIDDIHKQVDPAKTFFVCQHILVKHLNFGKSLVFTPHAEHQDDYVPIPHYSAEYDEAYIKDWDDREYDYSFIGDFNSHPIRRRMVEVFSKVPNTYFLDTGTWRSVPNRSAFTKLLGNTKYSLCPRGTGPGTIRFWEAIAMKSCPIHIGDTTKLPEATNKVLWQRLPESFDEGILLQLTSYDNTEYVERFCNDKLYVSVIETIKDKQKVGIGR